MVRRARSIGGRVPPDSFYLEVHRHIARAALSLNDEGVAPDPVLVRDRIVRDLGKDCADSFTDLLADLLECAQGSAHGEHYAEIVRAKAAERQALQGAQGLARDIQDGRLSPDEIAVRARDLAEGATGGTTRHEVVG